MMPARHKAAKNSLLLLALILTVLLVSGCQPGGGLPFFATTQTPTPTATATLTPTPTPSPTTTPTPTPLPEARIEDGDQALQEGDWDTALTAFMTASQASTDAEIQSAALLGIARTGYQSGAYSQAVEPLRQLIKNYPGSSQLPQAYFLLGQVYNALERYSDAADAYLNYLALRPGVVDAYVLNLRGDTLFAAGDYAGAANDFRAAMQAPSLNNPFLIELKLARAAYLSGDSETALALYADVYARTGDDHDKALVDLRKGQIYLDQGNYEQAYAAFQDAVNNFPTAYDSYSALLALVDAGVEVDELNRGIVDYYAGQYGVALAALDRYLQAAPLDPATAYYYSGLSQRALGGYNGAIAAWDSLIAGFDEHRLWDDAYEQKAYTQWYYLDQYTEAVQTLLDFVSRVPANPRAGEFLYDAAQVAERGGDLAQAIKLYLQVGDQYPAYEQAGRAVLLAGVLSFQQKDYPAAASIFQRMLGAATSLGDKAAATLWTGKVQYAQGDIVGAQATWEAAAAIDPTGYYSERALDLVRGRAPFTPPEAYDLVVDLPTERLKAESWLRTTFALPEVTELSGLGELAGDGFLQRGAELWKLGLYGEAQAEFEQLRQNVASDPVASYRLANYLAGLGLYRSASLSARQVLNVAGMSDADTMNAPAYFNHLRFGTYYANLIMPLAEKYNFHPLFLFSVIRQESLFQSFVSSSAAARGLMQIIPATGADIARNLGWPPDYTDADLFRPLVNLTLGVDYLDTQRNSFDGDMYAMLAAYNGGPGNARQWQELSGGDPDVFVEVVRFSETRTYIRSIYEIFNIYRRIYDRSP